MCARVRPRGTDRVRAIKYLKGPARALFADAERMRAYHFLCVLAILNGGLPSCIDQCRRRGQCRVPDRLSTQGTVAVRDNASAFIDDPDDFVLRHIRNRLYDCQQSPAVARNK